MTTLVDWHRALWHGLDQSGAAVFSDWLEEHGDPRAAEVRRADFLLALNEEVWWLARRIPRGTFWMSENWENAVNQVEIPHDFHLGVYPVTQAQWQAIMHNNPNHFSRDGKGKDRVQNVSDAELGMFPVEMVSWKDAQEFITKLNQREPNSGWLYRLPTEAEWEYACRGGATSKEECSFDYYLSKPTNDLSSKDANFDGNDPGSHAPKGPYLERTCKVGSYAPNRLGLYDMHGNVWEWCEDKYGSGGAARVFRGGSWDYFGLDCLAAGRGRDVPGNRSSSLGFRLALVPSQDKSGE